MVGLDQSPGPLTDRQNDRIALFALGITVVLVTAFIAFVAVQYVRTTRFEIDAGGLTIFRPLFFGTQVIRLGPEQITGIDVVRSSLIITPTEGEPLRLLTGRATALLDQIAISLRLALSSLAGQPAASSSFSQPMTML